MKKLKKSVKIILTISVSLVCVTAIVLGCIFGFKKPGEEPPTTPPPTGFSQAQKDLAAEINSNVKQMTYEVTDVPYASSCDLDDLTRFGSNYFAFTNEAGNEDFCTYYWDEENEEYVVLKLTDLNKHYGFLKPDHKSFAVEKLVENYVLFATYFEDEAYNKDYQKIYYSLVYFGNPEEPIEIFGFDTRETPMHVNQDGFVVEDDYFAFSYIDNFDMVNLIADYNVYFYPHSTTSISYKVNNENNYIKTSYTEDNAYGISKFYNNSFYVKAETGFNFYYLSGNDFKTISKSESYFDENLKTTYDFSEISKNKILISKIDYVLNQSEIKPSTILLNTFENGVKIYANYSYSILDVNLSLEKPLMVPDNYAKAVVNKNMSENLTNSYVVNFQKVDADGNLKQEFLTSYYNSNGEIVVNFTTTVPNEKILFAGTKTFLTKNQIFENDNSVLGKTKVVFDATTYTLANTDLINQSVFAITCNNNVGLMNIDGEILYNPENSQYSHFYNISGDTCYAYEKVFNKVYLLNYKTGSATLIEDLTTNTLLLANDIDLNILKNVENKNKITYDLKTLDNVLKVENITEFKNSKVLGDAFIEIYVSSLQPVKLIQIKEKDKADVNSYQVSLNVSNVEYQETAETYEGVTSQVLHASNPHIYDDPGYDTGNCTISQSENPTLTITMIDGYAMSDMSGYIYYGDGDYFIEAYHSFYFGGVNDSYFSCDFDGTWHTAMTFSFNSSRQLVYTARVSYVNKWWSWFKWHSDYSSVGINLWSDACSPVEHEVYFYGLWSNETNENSAQYSSTVNQVNLFDDHFYNEETTEKMWSKTIKYCDVSGNVYFPRVEDVYLRYGKLSSWRCFGYWEAFNSYVKQNTYAPSDYTDSNTISGSSSSFAQTHTPGYYTNETVNDNLASYYYASYSENQYTLTVDGTAHTYGATKTTDVFNYGPEKTGYTWIGYQVTGAGENQTPIVTYVNSAGTVLGTKEFEDHDGTFSFYFSDYAVTTGIYLQWLADADGSAVTMTSLYNPVVYTITLDTQSGSGGTSLIYVHYSVGVYLNCDLSGPTVSNQMTTSANPITCPTRTGYIFAGYYTTQNSGGTQYIDSSGKVTSDFSTTYFTAAGTLYARWTAITYTVRYDTSATTNTTLVATYDIEFNIPAPTTKQFHYFSGWSVSGVCGTVYAGTSSSTLTALDHTANSPTSTGSFGPTANNYFKNLTYSNGATVTITSNWTGNEYTVSFDPSGGRVNNAATYSFTANYGVEANLPSITKSGYTFTGWMVSGMDEETTHEFIGTTTNSITTATADLENVYTKFKSLRGSAGTVNFVAKWRANTYSVTYDLTTGSWAGTEVHPTGATYDIPLYVDNVGEAGWPFGYYFNGWTITDMAGTPLGGTTTSNMTNANVSSGTTTASIKYFKNLTNVDGGTVKLTARWQPYSYNIQYVANGANVTLNSSNPTSANYDATVTINDPTRIGYSFAGWSVSGLSDEIPHTANGTTFNSINGTYTNASNPNKLIFFKGSSTTCTFKNLHYVQGATVTLTANWTPAVYTITYHYADDSLFSSHPSLSTVNTSSNMTLTKTQSITYTHYFTTYAVSNLSTEPNAVAVPSGYKMVGWFLRSTTVTNSDVSTLSTSYRVAVNTEYLNDYAFQTGHSTNSTVDGNLHAYAVYEEVVFTLNFYANISGDSEKDNDLSAYSYIYTTKYITYGDSFTLTNFYESGAIENQYNATSYLISPNLYEGGNLDGSITSFTYNGTTYTSNIGNVIIWGISNSLARNPNNPVFYLYAENNELYGGTIDKLKFDYSSSGHYYVSAKSKDISGEVIIPARYVGTYGDYPVKTVSAAQAFSNCTKITSVTLPGTMFATQQMAFRGCTALTKVVIKEGIDGQTFKIALQTFQNCTALTTVELPSTVTSIAKNAFDGCSALESILLNEGLTTIETYAFSNCSSLTSITIPDTVTSLGTYAFSGCSKLLTAELSSGLTTLESYLFQNCYDLTTVNIKDGITVIGGNAFYNCSDLTKITLPNSVTTINTYAFYGCTSLADFTFSNNLTTIGSYVFNGCYGLTSIVLPNTLTSMSSYAFYRCSNLEEVTISSGLTVLESNVFAQCSKLSKVNIPSGITTIKTYAFSNCTSLESIVIPDTVTSLGTYVFYYCTALKEVTLSNSLTSLSENLFYRCESLIDVVIPDSVTTIGNYAFYNCTSLNDVAIPSSVTTIGDYAYQYCTSLTSFIVPGTVSKIGKEAFANCTSLINFEIEDGVVTMDWGVFQYCTALPKLFIPLSVTTINGSSSGSAYSMFYNANEDIIVCAEADSKPDGWNSYAFNVSVYYGASYSQYAVVDTAEFGIIGDTLVRYNGNATDVVIPTTVDIIAAYAFEENTTIESVVLGDYVTSLGQYAFYKCTSLKNVYLNDELTSIGHYAFGHITTISSIYIPSSVTSAGYYIFFGNSSIKIYCGFSSQSSGFNTSWRKYSMNNTISGYYLDYTRAEYMAAVYGSDYTFTDLSTGKVSISEYTGSATEIEIPFGVYSIGQKSYNVGAFASNTTLQKLIIPATLVTITSYGFRGCTALTTIDFTRAKSLKTISSYAFSNNTALTEVELPDSIATVGSPGAFNNCTSLKTLYLPGAASLASSSSTVATASPFYGCTYLTIYCGLSSRYSGWGDYSFVVSSTSSSLPGSLPAIAVLPVYYGITRENYQLFKNYPDFGFDGTTLTDYDGSDTNVTVPEGVTTIGSAFEGDDDIVSVTLSDTVTVIDEYAFYYCSSLTSVYLSDNLEEIRYAAFGYCDSLTTIFIPASVNIMESYIFNNSPTTIRIYCEASEKPDGWIDDWNQVSYSDTTLYTVIWGVTRAEYNANYASRKPVIPLEMIENQFNNDVADISYLEYAVMPSELVSNTIKTSLKED